MERYEMAEALRNKAKVSYDEARRALEASGWDMLQAMVILEKEGRLGHQQAPKAAPHSPGQQSLISRFIGWISGLIDQGDRHRFVITKDGRQTGSMTVTVFVVLALLFHGLSLFLLLMGLVLGYRYRFVSAGQIRDAQNAARDAESAADELKSWHEVNSMDARQAEI